METLTLQPPLLGESRAIEELRDFIVSVSLQEAPVLITGPGGTGKPLAAGKIHAIGPNASTPCCFLDADAVTAEQIAVASGPSGPGTILIHRADRLPADVAATIVDRSEAAGSAPRWILLSRHAPEEAAWASLDAAGLLEPLCGVHCRIPALGQRREDIPVLCRYHVWLHTLAEQFESRWEEFAGADLPALRERDWPGNVRELIEAVHARCGAREGMPVRWAGDEGLATAQEEYLRRELEAAFEEVRRELREGTATGMNFVLPHPGRELEGQDPR